MPLNQIFTGKKVKLLEWLLHYPDLNIIENLWGDLRHAKRSKKISDLEVFCKEEWENIPRTRIDP